KEPRPAKREQPPAGRPPEAAHPPPPQATHPPPPDATASPLELASAHQEGRAPQRAQDTPRPQATSAPDPDPDIEVEIGPEMLASILRVETAAEPRAPAKPAPAAPPPPPAPRAPSATVRPLRSRPGDRPRAPPTPSARSAPSTPPPAATALTPAESEAPTAPAPYRRVLRVVRPPKGEWLVSVAWGAGAVVAALALLAQIVDHHRDELAANARFNRPLTALYAALGVHLVPRWDVRSEEHTSELQSPYDLVCRLLLTALTAIYTLSLHDALPIWPPKGEWLVSVAWGAGAVVAALALLAQIVDHHRDELAANARFNRPLTALYAALGVHLVPRWDV